VIVVWKLYWRKNLQKVEISAEGVVVGLKLGEETEKLRKNVC